MNPISYARLLSTTSISQLARDLKVSKQYISRLEQGLYDKPNKEIMKWAADQINRHASRQISAADVERLYRAWQWKKREEEKANRGLQKVEVTKYDRISQEAEYGSEVLFYYKVFGQWVATHYDSPHKFCVAMCLHPSPVAEYIEGRARAMPKMLAEVLYKLDLIGEGFKVDER